MISWLRKYVGIREQKNTMRGKMGVITGEGLHSGEDPGGYKGDGAC